MDKEAAIYSCSVCGQIVTLLHKGGGALVCCNKVMQKGRTEEKSASTQTLVNVPYWSCSNCHYILQALQPPDICPSCGQACQFIDVSCYIPECGFSGVDSRLIK